MPEIECFNSTPEPGKYYEMVCYTRKSGTKENNDERYFTTDKPKYLGKLIENVPYHTDFRDIGTAGSFDNDGKKMYVSYGGHLCFIEVECNNKT